MYREQYKLFLFKIRHIDYIKVYDISYNVDKDIINIFKLINIKIKNKDINIIKELICAFSEQKCQKVFNNIVRKQKLKKILK